MTNESKKKNSENYSVNDWRTYKSGELYHHGILGQKWGVRRYQNTDGSLTDEGRRRYSYKDSQDAHLKSIRAKNAYDDYKDRLSESLKPEYKKRYEQLFKTKFNDNNPDDNEWLLGSIRDHLITSRDDKLKSLFNDYKSAEKESSEIDKKLHQQQTNDNIDNAFRGKGKKVVEISTAYEKVEQDPFVYKAIGKNQDLYDRQRKLYFDEADELIRLIKSGKVKSINSIDDYRQANPNSKATQLNKAYAKSYAEYMNSLRNDAKDLLGDGITDKVSFYIAGNNDIVLKKSKEDVVINVIRQNNEANSKYASHQFSDEVDSGIKKTKRNNTNWKRFMNQQISQQNLQNVLNNMQFTNQLNSLAISGGTDPFLFG